MIRFFENESKIKYPEHHYVTIMLPKSNIASKSICFVKTSRVGYKMTRALKNEYVACNQINFKLKLLKEYFANGSLCLMDCCDFNELIVSDGSVNFPSIRRHNHHIMKFSQKFKVNFIGVI